MHTCAVYNTARVQIYICNYARVRVCVHTCVYTYMYVSNRCAVFGVSSMRGIYIYIDTYAYTSQIHVQVLWI